MSVDSWSPEDHIRHFMYESIGATLSSLVWDKPHYRVLDFASKWYGDPDGGWRTHLRSMLKVILGGQDRFEHVLGEFPEYNIEGMPAVPEGEFDIVIADQVLEHVERPWLGAREILRVLKSGGITVVATPGLYPIHQSPVDCWRIMPDGYKVLFPEASFEWLNFGMWGNQERVGFEYAHNGGFPNGPPSTNVEQAMAQPYYVDGSDGRCPLQIWFVGRKR